LKLPKRRHFHSLVRLTSNNYNGYKFTLNIQPVIPISLTKDWNVIVRTILPVVSQHDLF
jgi:hypothetical protein